MTEKYKPSEKEIEKAEEMAVEGEMTPEQEKMSEEREATLYAGHEMVIKKEEEKKEDKRRQRIVEQKEQKERLHQEIHDRLVECYETRNHEISIQYGNGNIMHGLYIREIKPDSVVVTKFGHPGDPIEFNFDGIKQIIYFGLNFGASY